MAIAVITQPYYLENRPNLCEKVWVPYLDSRFGFLFSFFCCNALLTGLPSNSVNKCQLVVDGCNSNQLRMQI